MISALDNHLLRAYLDGEMDEAAAEAFEVLMIERPELAEFVDADTALRLGLSAAPPAASAAPAPAAAIAAPATPVPASAPGVLPFPPVRRPAGAWIPLLAAASVALAVGLVAGRFWSAAPGALVPTTLLSVDRLRSSVSAVPTLRLPADGMVVLSVPVAAEPGCTPTVRIQQGGRALQAQAAPDDFGFANLSLAATRLAPGKADVSVECNGQQRATYPVEFVR